MPAFTPQTIVDRQVQYPGRYALALISGDTYDLTAVPGTITQPGTPINATNMNNIEQGIMESRWYAVTTNIGNVYSVMLAPVPIAYYAGMRIMLKINADNTGSVTINANGLGAQNVKKANGLSLALGNWKTNSVITLVYNGTDFILQGSDSSGNATAADVRTGKEFSNDTGPGQVGTDPDNAGDVAAVSFHVSGTSIHVIPALGHTDGSDDAVVITDVDFVAANIKTGVNIFGVAGSTSVITTASGTVTTNSSGLATVTGLAFRPGAVILHRVNSNSTGFVAGTALATTVAFAVSFYGLASVDMTFTPSASGFTIGNGDISTAYYWRAYEE